MGRREGKNRPTSQCSSLPHAIYETPRIFHIFFPSIMGAANDATSARGQHAIAYAILYPEPEKRGRGNKGKATETADFSQRRLREARAILAFSAELARAVRDGLPLCLLGASCREAAENGAYSELAKIFRRRAAGLASFARAPTRTRSRPSSPDRPGAGKRRASWDRPSSGTRRTPSAAARAGRTRGCCRA